MIDEREVQCLPVPRMCRRLLVLRAWMVNGWYRGSDGTQKMLKRNSKDRGII
jgi:hypothetical protein